jgi:AcrR family transcriptional regulator
MSDKLGRPRDIALDAAIAAATESVLLAEGYAAVSIDRVAKIAPPSTVASRAAGNLWSAC